MPRYRKRTIPRFSLELLCLHLDSNTPEYQYFSVELNLPLSVGRQSLVYVFGKFGPTEHHQYKRGTIHRNRNPVIGEITNLAHNSNNQIREINEG